MNRSTRDEVPPAEAQQCLTEAYALVEGGRPGGAAQKCERALELVPNWAEAHYLYGTVLEQMGFVGKAQRAYDRAEQPDAISFDVRDNRPQEPAPPVANPPPPAEPSVEAVPAGPPERPNQLLEEAYAARDVGKLGSALRACQAVLAADPDWAEAHNLRGLVLEEMGHAEDAIAAYLAAVRLDPTFDDARRNLLEAGTELEDEGGFSEMVVLLTFSFPTEAEIARGRLEAENIPAVVTQGEIVAMNWLFSNMVGGVKLCVRLEDVEKAVAVLDWDLPLPAAPEERCPQCGSTEVRYEKYSLRWVYAAIVLLKIPLPVKKDRWTCRRCGASWEDREA